MRLNLGSSDRAIPGYTSVDIVPPAEVIADLRQPWPWPDSSVEAVKALDIIEHLPDRIHTMNELWRVLAPGARAEIEVPNAAKGGGQWQDPTHVAPWTLNSFRYFEDVAIERRRFCAAYGIKARFRIVSVRESHYQDAAISRDGSGVFPDEVYKIHVVLEAVK